MKIQEIITEDGRIVSGVNTTVDVKPGETERQAAKFFGHGKPKELHKKARKNSDPNTLYNMGLVAENPKFDDVGQKIYKDGKTRVVHSPVADKNISTLDQRVDKFASDRDRYNAGTNDAVMSTKGTNELIARSRNNIKQAYNKQDAVDARQGAGMTYITKGKPVKFDPKNSSSNIKLSMD